MENYTIYPGYMSIKKIKIPVYRQTTGYYDTFWKQLFWKTIMDFDTYITDKIEKSRLNISSDFETWLFDIETIEKWSIPGLTGFLTETECEKARRSKLKGGEERYILRKALLRIILGRCLNKDPGEITFAYNDFRKPYLEQAGTKQPLYFNISHTMDLLLIAVSFKNELGVDIEIIHNPKSEVVNMARACFSEREMDLFYTLPHEQHLGAFFVGWVQKEAISKAIGQGMAVGFSTLETEIVTGGEKHEFTFKYEKTGELFQVLVIKRETCYICTAHKITGRK